MGESVVRTAQKIEVSLAKTVHLRDYENETYTATYTATFNRPMTPAENMVETAKLQAELDYAIFNMLYQRKSISTHDFNTRIQNIKIHLNAVGAEDVLESLVSK